MGIGALIAVTGGAMFVLVIVGTVFLGRRTATPDLGYVAPDAFRLVPAMAGGADEDAHGEAAGHFEVPGTMVLALLFLMLFVVLYGYSWIELSGAPWLFR
jgi:cytochrome c oxidase subunit 1